MENGADKKCQRCWPNPTRVRWDGTRCELCGEGAPLPYLDAEAVPPSLAGIMASLVKEIRKSTHLRPRP